MENAYIENWQSFGQKALAAAKELETINTGTIEKLTGQQIELTNAAFETGSRYLAAITEVKAYQDLLAEQTRLATEYNEKLIESARATADILAETREAYQAWLETNMKAATENAIVPMPSFPSFPSFSFGDKQAA